MFTSRHYSQQNTQHMDITGCFDKGIINSISSVQIPTDSFADTKPLKEWHQLLHSNCLPKRLAKTHKTNTQKSCRGTYQQTQYQTMK